MLVEIEQAGIWRRSSFKWLLPPPKYTLQLVSESAQSVCVKIKGKRMVRVGLVLETPDTLVQLVLTIGNKREVIPIDNENSSLLFKTGKYKGNIKINVESFEYFLQCERKAAEDNNSMISNTIRQFSSHIQVLGNIVTRRMYNGETYTVDLDTMSTSDYRTILSNREIFTAHTNSKVRNKRALIGNENTEEAIFLGKTRRLRSSPRMFISIFSYVVFAIKRNECIESLYRLYSDSKMRNQIYRRVSINFIGEMGEDHGALRKEMFEVAAARIVEDKRICIENGRFNLISSDVQERDIEKKKVLDISDEEFYSFFGFFLGYVIYQQVQVHIRFSKLLYIALLSQEYTISDIEDEKIQKSIQWLQRNDVENLGLYFNSGKEVTNKNKARFIEEMLRNEIHNRRPGYKYMYKGFHSIVSHEILDFTPAELERLISGVEIISLDYLKQNAVYKQCSETTREVRFFWEILEEEDENYRRMVMLFITGSSTVQQLSDAANESLVIEKMNAKGHLPSAHACFRRIILYTYETKEDLKEKLTYAINESGGFHFV